MKTATDKHLELFMNELTRRILNLGVSLRPHDVLMTVSTGLRGLGNPHNLRGEIVIAFTPFPGQVDVVRPRPAHQGTASTEDPTPE